ncbi:MAG: polyphosphate kinase 1 [Acidimicrobiia bacterium]|nr:polyphosphate kinase 1 [Acidimicrobiia bacterium]
MTRANKFIDRELSWLDFNSRVLHIAEDPATPLLERIKFLAIFTTNLDEFFEIRVAGILEQVAAGIRRPALGGMYPTSQLRAIRARVEDMYQRVDKTLRDEIVPGLAKAGVHFRSWEELSEENRAYLTIQFHSRVFPVVTPLSVDPGHPFPYLSNMSLNLAIAVRDPATGETRFARVKVPPILPRFLVLPKGDQIVSLEEVIAAHLDSLFPGMEIVSHVAFRVTRNADITIEEEEAHDLLEFIESELNRRRFGRVVRLEVEPSITEAALSLLVRELDIGPDQVYVTDGPLDMTGFWGLYDLDRPDLKWDPYVWVTPRELVAAPGERVNIFDRIREGDIFVQHPYDSFASSVQELVTQAATDPRVLAIKQTLYRTSAESPSMHSLIAAAEAGKQVVALVELKARFDEQANIEWARRLEESSVHVVYGLVGLKTHTKTTLVVRDDGDQIRRYSHIGTGNYHDKTARVYEDIGLLTADPEIGADLSDLFNFLTGYSKQVAYRKLLVSPITLRKRMIKLIRKEAKRDDGHIVMKMNSLVDGGMIRELYRASQAGTRIDLIVRGICCLRPGVEGLSENITVRGLVGRYLEHSRIYRFGTEDRGYEYLIGSADLMPRNLDRRVEVVGPIADPGHHERFNEILDVLFADDELAWELQPDGIWRKVETVEGINAHLRLQEMAIERTR